MLSKAGYPQRKRGFQLQACVLLALLDGGFRLTLPPLTDTGIGPKTASAETDPYGNPGGYCGLGGTGVSCPVGLGAAQQS